MKFRATGKNVWCGDEWVMAVTNSTPDAEHLAKVTAKLLTANYMPPLQEKHYQEVQSLYSAYMYEEAAERGYDAKAASAAREAFNKAKSFYEMWYGVRYV